MFRQNVGPTFCLKLPLYERVEVDRVQINNRQKDWKQTGYISIRKEEINGIFKQSLPTTEDKYH